MVIDTTVFNLIFDYIANRIFGTFGYARSRSISTTNGVGYRVRGIPRTEAGNTDNL